MTESSHRKELPELTVIIPVRENGSINVVERLAWRKGYAREGVELLLIDDGSPLEHASAIRDAAESLGITYQYLETRDASFSLARARNAAIRSARTPFCYFEDIDFLGKADFYQQLRRLAGRFDQLPFNFLSIPTLFLTSQSSKRLLNSPAFDDVFDEYVARLPFVDPDQPNDLVDSFAPVGSNILVKRETCFHVGLFDEFFNSWGGEDREFVFRLLKHSSRNLKPAKFAETKKWRIHRTHVFEGWRALYRLHGEYVRNLGIYSMHIHHPENSWKNQFSREANFKYCDDKIAAIERGRVKPMPIRIPDASEHSVLIGRNPTFFNDDVMETLGSVAVVDIDYNVEPEEFADRVVAEDPANVLFQNVYSNEWMTGLWCVLKDRGMPCVCVERGAFPNSIYFDPGGFCAESPSYDKSEWAAAAPIDAAAYVASLNTAAMALEPQGEGSISEVTEKLSEDKKNVVVLLQSLTDATTRYFTGELEDYDAFLATIRSLDKLGKYNVLVKNHPLNREMPLNAGIDVSDANIYDLIEIADVCITLNSGAGLLALGAGCPVIAMGQCFYAKPGLAVACHELEEIERDIDMGVEYDRQSVDRFYGYLLNDFYSHADWTYGVRKKSDNTNMSLMRDVKYNMIRFRDRSRTITKPSQNKYSLLMDPYAYDLFVRRTEKSVKEPDAAELKAQMLNARTPGQRMIAKLKKLGRDPHAYFNDVKSPALRPMRHLFPAKAKSKRGKASESITRDRTVPS